MPCDKTSPLNDRDEKMLKQFEGGDSYIRLSIRFGISESGIKQALSRTRKRLGLIKVLGVR